MRRAPLWFTLALGGLLWLGCSEDPTTCVALGETLAEGQTLDDPQACVRCVCAEGQARCRPLVPCGDAVAPREAGLADADSPSDAGPRDASPADDAGPDPGDAGPACDVADTRCLDVDTLLLCDERQPEPRTLQRVFCAEDERCVVDRCTPPICAPDEIICRFGRPVQCDAEGFPSEVMACPEGEVCAGGSCVEPQPEVLLLVDTSGSMAEPVNPEVPTPLPACEPPDAPYTRLGLVKRALTTLFDAPEASGLRLGLMHFPQRTVTVPDCPRGYYTAATLPLGDPSRAQILSAEALDRYLPLLMAVPFSAVALRDLDALRAWTDFDEAIADVGACDVCAEAGVCHNGRCQEHTEPELRAGGGTPIGRSLYIAAEYLQRYTLREGARCEASADCGAPYYRCRDGRCHDPLGPCRTRTIILFTDGGETEDVVTTSFYYPSIQAKRMAMGLSCTVDDECLAPAVCDRGACTQGSCDFDPTQPCGRDADCPGAETCQPDRSRLNTSMADTSLVLRHPDGSAARITVNVVDSSNTALNQQIAHWGQGRYLHLATFTIDALVEAFRPLFVGAKDRVLACLEQQP